MSANNAYQDMFISIQESLDAYDQLVIELEQQRKEAKKLVDAEVYELVQLVKTALESDPRMMELGIADLYWNIQRIPVEYLKQIFCVKDVLTIAKAHQLHDYPCHTCNKSVTFNSRSDMQHWAKYDGRYYPQCDDCKAIEKSQQAEASRLRYEQQAAKLHELKTMPYAAYLKTDHWQDMRYQMMRRARFKCQLCSSSGTLHVHHRTYERRGQEDYKDLIVLCAHCHAKFHDKLPADQGGA